MPRLRTCIRSVLDSDRKRIGTRLRDARIKAGFTQQAIAQDAGIATSVVCHYETGRCLPSLVPVVRMCKAYGISIDGLVEGLEL